MKKNKVIILTSIIVGVLVVTLGLTYAAITFNETKGNSQLVLGDIWMHYKESDTSINAVDMMPTNLYQANPIMQTQELNELEKCINYFAGYNFDVGSTAMNFCKGSGTYYGKTIQEYVNSSMGSSAKKELLNRGVLILEGVNYLVNPIMQTQKIESELGVCVSKLKDYGIRNNPTDYNKDFCLDKQEFEGYKFSALLNTNYFSESDLIELLNNNIIIKNNSNIPYFEFEIEGLNTYTKEDIYYEIDLVYGDKPDDKNTRINDELLRFSLVEVVNGEETILLENRSYDDLTNKRIWIETINKNTLNKITKTYRLYMWIDGNTKICSEGTTGCDYYLTGDTNNWNNVFGSVKVKVNGDFREKSLAQDASCFTYKEVPDLGNYYVYHNLNTDEYEAYELNTSDEASLLCANYMVEYFDGRYNNIDGLKLYCKGMGLISYDRSLYYDIGPYEEFTEEDINYFVSNNILIPVDNPKIGITITGYDISCGHNVVIPSLIDNKEVLAIGKYTYRDNDIFGIDAISSVSLPDTLTYIGHDTFYGANLKSIIIPDGVTRIHDFAFLANSLEEVQLPESLKFVGNSAFDGNYITTIQFSNQLTTIGDCAFCANKLVELNIPDSVVFIHDAAFANDTLKKVIIGSGVKYIDKAAFSTENNDYNSTVESITFKSKTCDEIKNISGEITDDTKYFPWLYRNAPYYKEGYKVKVFGTDGECSY